VTLITLLPRGRRDELSGSMNPPHSGQNCSSPATVAPQCSQTWETTALLQGYCATTMGILAVRSYEPWTITSTLAGFVLLALVVGVLIFAVGRGNR
jgi:hypothetical protein